jgi:uncharacterized membrane protein HdeD (DUF308 family)
MKSARAFRTSPRWDEAGRVRPGLTFVLRPEGTDLVRWGEVALETMPSRQTNDGDPQREPLTRGRELELAKRVARLWWIGVLRGVIALALGVSALLASGSPERLATFLALYWLAGGVVTLRLAWAMRPSLGFRLAAVAGVVAITAAFLVVLREFLSGVISPVRTINILGLAALAMGTLRLVGAFEIERRTGHRWSIGGLILGGLELGTGILLIATDRLSRGVMITVGVWALTSGTLLIVEAIRARRRVSALLEPRAHPSPQPTDRQR